MAIDLNTIKKMPFRTKIAMVIVVFCLIGAVYWFNFLQVAVEKRTDLQIKLEEMKEKIDEKNKVAEQIKKIQADVASLKEKYKTALLKLPDQREIPALFHSISSAGKDAGVGFLLFEPKASIPRMLDKSKEKTGAQAAAAKSSAQQQKDQAKDLPPEIAKIVESRRGAASSVSTEPFYEEIPVSVSVTGTFQNTLFFFDKLAKLPRIVNVSDITMNRVDTRDDVKGKNFITSNCTIKTYMFIEKKEKPADKPGEKPGEKPNEKK